MMVKIKRTPVLLLIASCLLVGNPRDAKADEPSEDKVNALIRAGDAALQEGLPAKAATAYADAWRAASSRDDLALKAGQLWAERTEDIAEGAKIYRELQGSARDESVRSDARQRLDRMQTRLEILGESKSREAMELVSQGKWDDAIRAYRIAADAVPSLPSNYYNLADALAARGRVQEAMTVLRLGSREAPLSAKQVLSRPHLADLAGSQEFVGFLGDLLGPSAKAAARSIYYARELTGAWRDTSEAEPLRVSIVQKGPAVTIRCLDGTERYNVRPGDKEDGVLVFEGEREGNVLRGKVRTQVESRSCPSDLEKTEGEISPDGRVVKIKGWMTSKKRGTLLFSSCRSEPRDIQLERAEESSAE